MSWNRGIFAVVVLAVGGGGLCGPVRAQLYMFPGSAGYGVVSPEPWTGLIYPITPAQTGVTASGVQRGPFQPGIAPAGYFSIPAGASRQLAAYCADVMANAPGLAVSLIPDPGVGDVQLAGTHTSLLAAVEQGTLSIRGSSESWTPTGSHDSSLALTLTLVNESREVMTVRMDAGTVLTPVGQKRPVVDARAAALFTTAPGSPAGTREQMAFAVWAAAGSTVQDLGEQRFAFVSARDAAAVEQRLTTAGIKTMFDAGRARYQALYERRLAELGSAARSIPVRIPLSNGAPALGTLTRTACGDGVLELKLAIQKDNGARLFYSAHTETDPEGGFVMTLSNPLTGRPVPGVEPLVFPGK